MNTRSSLALIMGLMVSSICAAADRPAPTLWIGDAAPLLRQGTYVQGQPVTAFASGTVYVVEFWSTWCGPCRTAIPHINALQQKLADRGLVVIGQDVWERGDDIEGAVRKFIGQMGTQMTYRAALDRDGAMAETWMKAAGRGGIPCAFVVDQAGRIAWMGHPLAGLDDVVEKVLAGTHDLAAARQEQARNAAAQAARPAPPRQAPVLRSAGNDLPALAQAIAAKPPEPKLPEAGLLAYFPLRDSASNQVDTASRLDAKGAAFAGGALYLNGAYEHSGASNRGYRVVAAIPGLSYSNFTVALRFWPIDLGHNDVIFMGGTSYRWLGLNIDAEGNLRLTTNNGRQSYPLDIRVAARQWHHVICSVDLSQRLLRTVVDGEKRAEIRLPTDFQLEVIGSSAEVRDKVVAFTDYASGRIFHGFVADLRLYDHALSNAERPAGQE